MGKNVINIVLTLNEIGIKRFKTVPAFKNLLYNNQINSLVIGDNHLVVNHTVWGALQNLVQCDNQNMSIIKK